MTWLSLLDSTRDVSTEFVTGYKLIVTTLAFSDETMPAYGLDLGGLSCLVRMLEPFNKASVCDAPSRLKNVFCVCQRGR